MRELLFGPNSEAAVTYLIVGAMIRPSEDLALYRADMADWEWA